MALKFFEIERRWSRTSGTDYRFRSLYNNCTGCWTTERKEAVQDGQNHAALICAIHKIDNPEK